MAKKKKKVVKKKPKARKADTLPPVIVPGTDRMRDALKKRLGVQPREFGARIPRGSRSPALDTSMLLSPLGAGPALRAGRGAKAARKATKKPKRKGLGAGLKAGAGAGAGLGPLGMIGGALSGAMAARPAMSALRKLAATKAAKDKRGAARRKKPRKRVY